jgi:phosphopantothenoylcysteine decarboxylase / phosphopantothenate---cysteine ligase
MLKEKKFLVTAGPTYESIDPVRFIGNRSSGKMGYYIATELVKRGGEVYLVIGPNSIQISNSSIHTIPVETANEMFDRCIEIFPECNVSILAAAVSDYAPIHYSQNKIKKSSDDELIIHLKKTRDILGHLGKIKANHQILVGFSLESENEINNAVTKLQSKNLDFIILNSLNDTGAGFNYNTNKITIIDKEGQITAYPLKSKQDVASDIVNYLEKIVKKRESI